MESPDLVENFQLRVKHATRESECQPPVSESFLYGTVPFRNSLYLM
jgi:hypothetical protein